MAGKQVPSRSIALEDGAAFVSVSEAARLLGVSSGSIYGYIRRGKLTKRLVDERIMLREEEVLALDEKRSAMQLKQPSYMLMLTAQVRPGCKERFEEKLKEFYTQNKHIIPDTSKQLILRDKSDPEHVMVLLFWRNRTLPFEEQCQEALAALIADLNEVCDWDEETKHKRSICSYV